MALRGREALIRSLAAIAVCSAALVAASAAAAPTPRWQLVPGAVAGGEPMWVAGRLWFFQGSIRSAPIRNGRVGSWRTAGPRLGSTEWQYEGRLDDALVFAGSREPDAPLYAIKLLPNGLLTAPTELDGAPAPRSSTGSNAVRLPDRPVRLVALRSQGGGLVPIPGICCDVNGQPVSLRALTGLRVQTRLGVDRQGRLWLAWAPVNPTLKSQARIVELDLQTLAPRGKATAVPRFRGSALRAMVCASTCRLIVRGTGTVSWAPGESAPTPIRVPGGGACPRCFEVVAAREDAGRLVLAYTQSSGNSFTIGLARGDARGSRLRPTSRIQLPATYGTGLDAPILTSPGGYGALGDDGFAAAAMYRDSGTGRSYLRVAIMPLRP